MRAGSFFDALFRGMLIAWERIEYIQIFTISAIFFILILLELFYYVPGDIFEESILERENIEDIYDKKGGYYYNVNYN